MQVSALSMSPSNGDDDAAENWNEFHISLSNDELERHFPDTGIVDMEDEVEWDEVFDELSEQCLMLDSSVESSRSDASQSSTASSWQSESAEDFSVGIVEVLEAVEAAEIIADLSTSREAFSACLTMEHVVRNAIANSIRRHIRLVWHKWNASIGTKKVLKYVMDESGSVPNAVT